MEIEALLMQHSQVKADDPVEPIVYVVDGEEMREALIDLLMLTEKRATAFSSGPEFVEMADIRAPGCLVLDLSMPGGTGLDLQQHLSLAGSPLPVISITGHADIPTSVKTMRAGATDFIIKPLPVSIFSVEHV